MLLTVTITFQDKDYENVRVLVVIDSTNPQMRQKEQFQVLLAAMFLNYYTKHCLLFKSTDSVLQETLNANSSKIAVCTEIEAMEKQDPCPAVKTTGRKVCISSNSACTIVGTRRSMPGECSVLV